MWRGLILFNDITALFTNMRKPPSRFSLPSIIITITSNEPLNTETHKTGRNPPITNQKPWPFEPVKVKFCFLRGPLRWMTAAKNAIVSWLLNFKPKPFVNGAEVDTGSRFLWNLPPSPRKKIYIYDIYITFLVRNLRWTLMYQSSFYLAELKVNICRRTKGQKKKSLRVFLKTKVMYWISSFTFAVICIPRRHMNGVLVAFEYWKSMEKAPCTRIPVFVWKQIFFFGLAYRPQVFGENGHRKRIFSKNAQGRSQSIKP